MIRYSKSLVETILTPTQNETHLTNLLQVVPFSLKEIVRNSTINCDPQNSLQCCIICFVLCCLIKIAEWSKPLPSQSSHQSPPINYRNIVGFLTGLFEPHN